MSFLNIQIQLNTYDQILDCYNTNNLEEAKKLINSFNLSDRQNFIYWLFKNYENINNQDLIAFILDEIF